MLTQEQRQQYQECRIQKMQVDKNFQLIFWGHVVLTAVFVLMALLAGAFTSKTGGYHGAYIWYNSFESGILELICAVITIVLALFAGAKQRVPSNMLLGFFVLAAIVAILPEPSNFIRANLVPCGFGIALNVWQQMQYAKLNWLKDQPGYPLFSEEASHPAHYESLYHVKAAQPADSDMDAVGGTQYAERRRQGEQPLPQAQAEVYGFADLNGSQSMPHPASEQTLHASGDVALAAMAADAKSGRQTAVQPVPTAESLLTDMSAEGSSHHKNYAPDESALPTPEEVRARLAAMKQNRKD